MFNTSGLETPPWSTNIHKTHAMVLLNKEKSASLEDKKPISAGKFAPTSPPACLQQSDLITIPGQSTLLVVQIATTLARFLWCGALKMNLCSWPLSLHSSRISSHDKASGEQNPDLVSGPRHLARSISYSFFGVGRCHRDLPHIRFQLRSGSLSRKWLEQVGRELLAGDSNTRLIATGDGISGVHNSFASIKYIIFTKAIVSWYSTENITMAIASSFSADRQSRLQMRTICLSLMIRYPRINNQGISHHRNPAQRRTPGLFPIDSLPNQNNLQHLETRHLRQGYTSPNVTF